MPKFTYIPSPKSDSLSISILDYTSYFSCYDFFDVESSVSDFLLLFYSIFELDLVNTYF